MLSKIGRVRMYEPAKGIGFIIPSDGGKDVMFHKSILHGGARSHRPRQGDIVEYDDHDTPTGRRAVALSQVMIEVRALRRSLKQRDVELRAAAAASLGAGAAQEFTNDADLLRQADLALAKLDSMTGVK